MQIEGNRMKRNDSPGQRPEAPGAMQFTLASHTLCPYVQRAAIVLGEKNVAFERRWVDLAAKPDWFLAISPLGKTPVLLVNGEPVFESAVICEFLDETIAPRLHPGEPLARARHRGWMEFGSAVLNTIAAFYNAPDEQSLRGRRAELQARLSQLEAVVAADGPYFAGREFGMVDAVFAPVFRYFDVFAQLGQGDFLAGSPRLRAWRAALSTRASVVAAAPANYSELLREFLLHRGSALSKRIAAGQAACTRLAAAS
jgi:glutathione S-transferase